MIQNFQETLMRPDDQVELTFQLNGQPTTIRGTLTHVRRNSLVIYHEAAGMNYLCRRRDYIQCNPTDSSAWAEECVTRATARTAARLLQARAHAEQESLVPEWVAPPMGFTVESIWPEGVIPWAEA